VISTQPQQMTTAALCISHTHTHTASDMRSHST